MTINLSDNNPRISYAVGAGVTQSSFTVPFEFFDNSDLNVYVDDVLKTITTDYTVTGGDGSTGSISMSVTGASGGSTVAITRSVALERTTDFPVSGAFNIATLNTELDKFTALAADIEDKSNRAVRLQDSDGTSTLSLPLTNDRKNKAIAFDSTGAVLAAQELGTWRGDWATGTAYNERDLVRDTDDGSIYIVTSAHTSTGAVPLDSNTNSSKYDAVFDAADLTIASMSLSGNLTVNGNTTLGNATSDTINTLGRISNNLIPNIDDLRDVGSTSLRWNYIYARRGDFSGNVEIDGTTTLNGSVNLGNTSGDTIDVAGKIDSSLIPKTSATRDLGSSLYQWKDIHIDGTGYIDTVNAGTMSLYGERIQGVEIIENDSSSNDLEIRLGTDELILKDSTNTRFGKFLKSGSNLKIISATASSAGVTFNSSGGFTTGSGITVGGNVSAVDVIASGDVTITGDLTVNGQTTTVNTTQMVVSDPMIALGDGRTGTPTGDVGLVLDRGDEDNAFIGYDESADKFVVGTGSSISAGNSAQTITTTGTLVADIEGDVTGDLTGDVTGNVTGDLTGNLVATVDAKSIRPETDSTYNLGADATRWDNVYADDLHGDWAGTARNDIVPKTDGIYDLGASDKKFDSIWGEKGYLENIRVGHSTTTTSSTYTLIPTGNHIRRLTLGSNLTLSTNSWSDGDSMLLMIFDGSDYTITWPSMVWANNAGNPPALRTSGATVVSLWYSNSALYGAVVGAA